jgi:EAL domain-containing protein (putative c-di-GMP-specific phosphodiesterase class I)
MFQPIVQCRDCAIYGYDALVRGPSESPLHAPATLFDTAQRQGRLAELALLCREVAIARFGALQLPGKLFVNVMPGAILSGDFQNGKTREFLLKAGLQPARAVIELTE